jgi:N-terminal domain of (some) glycogen debranching enzymes
VLTINQGSTFMVTDERGEIDPESEQGVFAGDTRFVSSCDLTINRVPWDLQTSTTTDYYKAHIYFSNPKITTEQGVIQGREIGLEVTRSVSDGVHEDFDLTNYSLAPVRFNLGIALQADFADLFEVKSHTLAHRGRITSHWDGQRHELVISYANQDFHRQLIYRLTNFDSPPLYANGSVYLEVELQPRQSWHACANYILAQGDRVRNPELACPRQRSHDDTADRLHALWRDCATTLTTANEDVYRTYQQSVDDMGALASTTMTLPKTSGCQPRECPGSSRFLDVTP